MNRGWGVPVVHPQTERLTRLRVDHGRPGWERTARRPEDKLHDPIDKDECDQHTNRDDDAAFDDPGTQLVEMLQESHLGAVRRFILIGQQLIGKCGLNVIDTARADDIGGSAIMTTAF